MAKQRIVVKVGSNVLTRSDGKLDVTRMSALVDQIVWLRQHNHEVILVSSGAMAGGRGELRVNKKLDAVEQRQLFSAVGQVKLIGLYYDLFRERGVHVGQVLTMKENFGSRREYLNQRACMSVMLDNGVLPIVNENDTVSVTELMFTDNDELSGLIAAMMDARTLIILTNVDGIYDGSPTDSAAHVISRVEPGKDLSDYVQTEKSGFGRGGMLTKCSIARKVADEGIRVVIANGRRDDILCLLMEHPETTVHTEFVPSEATASGVKKWIAHTGSFAKGEVQINAILDRKLQEGGVASILFAGVSEVRGDFEEGDIVTIVNEDGRRVGAGRANYDADDARKLIGRHDLKPLIHYDYLYVE